MDARNLAGATGSCSRVENDFYATNPKEVEHFLLHCPYELTENVLVCSHRVSIWRNGKETKENGKRLASTMAYAWFICQKGYFGKTEVRWI